MKKLRSIIAAGLMLTMAAMITACGSSSTSSAGTGTTGAAAESGQTGGGAGLKVGIVLTTSGKGDKSFNDSAIAGLDKAKAELGIEYKEVQPKEASEIEKSIENLANAGYQVIFTVGFNTATALTNVAPNYPDTKFVIIDHDFKDGFKDNLKSLLFKEEEGSFLAGVLAAEQSTTNVVGFVGGMESPLIQKFEVGFEAGVKAAKPDAEVLIQYVSSDASGFNNPSRAKEITLNMISKNADVIYHAAGGSGQGMLDAANEKGIIAIGVDSNQNWVKPGTVIASMLKRVDFAVYDVVKAEIDGTLEMGGAQVYGLDSNGVSLTDLTELTGEETNGISEADQQKIKDIKATISDDTKARIEDFKAQIIEGKLTVPSAR